MNLMRSEKTMTFWKEVWWDGIGDRMYHSLCTVYRRGGSGAEWSAGGNRQLSARHQKTVNRAGVDPGEKGASVKGRIYQKGYRGHSVCSDFCPRPAIHKRRGNISGRLRTCLHHLARYWLVRRDCSGLPLVLPFQACQNPWYGGYAGVQGLLVPHQKFLRRDADWDSCLPANGTVCHPGLKEVLVADIRKNDIPEMDGFYQCYRDLWGFADSKSIASRFAVPPWIYKRADEWKYVYLVRDNACLDNQDSDCWKYHRKENVKYLY